MTESVNIISVPQENVGDEYYEVVQFLANDAGWVVKGTPILELESSKAVFEVEASVDGYLHLLVEVGDQVQVGEALCVISSQEFFDKDALGIAGARQSSISESESSSHFSDAAKSLLEENNIDPQVFDGQKLVTEKVVRAFLERNHREPVDWRSIVDQIHDDQPMTVVWGGGGHARMCLDVLRQTNTGNVIGFVASPHDGSEIYGIPYLGGEELLPELFQSGVQQAVLGIGDAGSVNRTELFEKLCEIGFRIPTIIHPQAIVEPSVTIGSGSQIMAGAIVGSSVKIGTNCIINAGSVVSHDSVISDGSHIAPGAILAGGVEVGEESLVGMGATIFMKVKIGSHSVINNGCAVYVDVADNTTIKR